MPAAQVFSCGTGLTFFRASVSTHGNLAQLESPAGSEYYLKGTVRSGYRVCYSIGGGPFVSAHDFASIESGFGSAATVQPNGPNTFPLEITRTTNDGVLTITRRITGNSFVVPGSGSLDLNGNGVLCDTLAECGNCTNRTIHILTRVKNNTGAVATIRVIEMADGDLSDGAGIVAERGLSTSNSVAQYRDASADGGAGGQLAGVLLQSLITPPLTAIQSFGGFGNPPGVPLPVDCATPSLVTPTGLMDAEMGLRMDITVGPGSTDGSSVRVHHRRF